MTLTPQLLFDGTAEAAMQHWAGIFPAARIASVDRFEGGEMAGKVRLATLILDATEIRCADSPVRRDFSFTPAISFAMTGTGREETARLFAALAEGGEVLMPLQAYDFADLFGWVQDRWGVSWQLMASVTDG